MRVRARLYSNEAKSSQEFISDANAGTWDHIVDAMHGILSAYFSLFQLIVMIWPSCVDLL
jgi:hypothetical protein